MKEEGWVVRVSYAILIRTYLSVYKIMKIIVSLLPISLLLVMKVL
jgi:hypothetical protein